MTDDDIKALREALKAEQDEVHRLQASHSALYGEVERLRAARVPLTDAEIDAVTRQQWGEQLGVMFQAHRAYARAIERAHGITGEQE
jgi:uncharacterized protein YdcH (DUF465 family)